MMTLDKAWEYDTMMINANGPELVRAQRLEFGLYGVQTYSETLGRWITQAEHADPKAAKEDAGNWY